MSRENSRLGAHHCATNAASRETDSPSGLVRSNCCGPAESGGVVISSVFKSLNVTLADLPPRVAFVADWKPLPRMVTLVPPAADPKDGERLPIPRGTSANWMTVRPDVVSAKRYTPFSSVVRKQP